MLKRATATLPAADIERAANFYENKLELSRGEGSAAGVYFACEDGSRIFVFPRPGGANAENTAASWDVEHLPHAMSRLKDRGVAFESYDIPGITVQDGIHEFDNGRAAFFKDTEGNILSLVERT